MSISDLARRSGVSRATVNRILGGKDEHYSVSNFQAVLSALGMKMDLLATGDAQTANKLGKAAYAQFMQG